MDDYNDINLEDIDLIVEEKTIGDSEIFQEDPTIESDSDFELEEIMQKAMNTESNKTFISNEKSFGKQFNKQNESNIDEKQDTLALSQKEIKTEEKKMEEAKPQEPSNSEEEKSESSIVKLLKKLNKTIIIMMTFALCTILLLFSGETIDIDQTQIQESPQTEDGLKNNKPIISTQKKKATDETLSTMVYQMSDVIALINNIQSITKEESNIVNKYYNKEIESKDVTRFFKQSLSKKEELVATYNKSYKLTEADNVFSEVDKFCREVINASKVTLKSVPSGHSKSTILNAFNTSLQTQEAIYKSIYQNIEKTLTDYDIVYEIVDNQLLISKTSS